MCCNPAFRLQCNKNKVGTRVKNVGLQNTSSGYTVGTEGYTRKLGRPGKNWLDNVRRDLKDMGTTPLPGMKPKNWRQTEQKRRQHV